MPNSSTKSASKTSGPCNTCSEAAYIEIQQLVARYAHAIDTCSNNGYDCADLYVPDGECSNNRSQTKWKGRDRLAEAAGGGPRGCKKLETETFRSHVIVNHVIEWSAEGAIGKSHLVYPGIRGQHSDADHSGHVGGYKDVYVKTGEGWRQQELARHTMRPAAAEGRPGHVSEHHERSTSGMFADTIRAAVPDRVRCFSPASPRAAPTSVWQRRSI